jgi:DNA-binding beta-propeller fold protein YncE
MKQHRWKWLIALVMSLSFSGVLAQTDAVTQYSSEDIIWRIDATIDYVASPAESANLFLGVATDAEGNLYIANYNNILIFDGETGEKIGAIVDESGTIQQYSDIAVASDGTFWIADRRSNVYRVDAAGNILSTVVFETSPGFDEVQNPGQIEFDPDGNLYVNYSGYGVHFQVFSPEGEYIRSIITGADRLAGAMHFTFAPDGALFFQGAGIGWITEEDGLAVAHEFAPEFMAEQEFDIWRGIALDYEGNVYFLAGTVIDGKYNLSVFHLDSEGTLIGRYGHGQEGQGDEFKADEIGFDGSLAIDPDGKLIVAHFNAAYSQLINLNVRNGS